MIKIAVTKGRIEKDVCKLLQKSGFDTEPIENKERKLKIKTKDDIELVFAKSNDVLKFTKLGIVDLGIIGKDILDETGENGYTEVLDLNVGKCYFAVATRKDYNFNINKDKIRIATKYPKIASKYFKNKTYKEVEIIKMEGSVELGPIIGLADAIVDIVETGDTLKANDLIIVDKVSDISTRMIANNNSLLQKKNEINNIVEKFRKQIIN